MPTQAKEVPLKPVAGIVFAMRKLVEWNLSKKPSDVLRNPYPIVVVVIFVKFKKQVPQRIA
jgi:hypothetical protein